MQELEPDNHADERRLEEGQAPEGACGEHTIGALTSTSAGAASFAFHSAAARPICGRTTAPCGVLRLWTCSFVSARCRRLPVTGQVGFHA
jgi:hypothetical protein